MDRSLIEGFISIFSARLFEMAVSIVALPLIVRVLDPSGYGDYAFLMSILTFLVVFVSSGVTEGVQKFAAENRESAGWRQDVVGFYVRLAAVLAIVGAVAVALSVELGFVDRVFASGYDVEFYLLALSLIVIQFRQLGRRILMAFGLERFSESLNAANKLVTIGLGLGLASLGFGVAGMLAGSAIGNALIATVGLALVFRRVPVRAVVRWPSEGFPRRQLLSFNTLNVVLVVLMMSLYHVDVMMVRLLVGSEQTGYYKAALALAQYLWLVPISLEVLLLHSTSALWSDGAIKRINTLAARVTRYTVLLALLLAVGIAALADRFVPLYYGADFLPVIVPILWLLPGTVGFAAARPIIAISQARGELRPLIVATGAAALLNFVLNVLLITRYGIVGAAVATSVGYLSMLVFHVLTARHVGFDPFDDLRAGRIAATTATTIAVVFSISLAVEGTIFALVVVPPAGFLTHVIVGLASGAIDVSDVRQLASSVRGPLPIGS